MLRFTNLNPRVFVELLLQAGCVAGLRRHGLQQVSRADRPQLTILVRMGQPVMSDEIAAHLANLGISESVFQDLLDRYRPPSR